VASSAQRTGGLVRAGAAVHVHGSSRSFLPERAR